MNTIRSRWTHNPEHVRFVVEWIPGPSCDTCGARWGTRDEPGLHRGVDVRIPHEQDAEWLRSHIERQSLESLALDLRLKGIAYVIKPQSPETTHAPDNTLRA